MIGNTLSGHFYLDEDGVTEYAPLKMERAWMYENLQQELQVFLVTQEDVSRENVHFMN